MSEGETNPAAACEQPTVPSNGGKVPFWEVERGKKGFCNDKLPPEKNGKEAERE